MQRGVVMHVLQAAVEVLATHFAFVYIATQVFAVR
jgi:hypothetical protein